MGEYIDALGNSFKSRKAPEDQSKAKNGRFDYEIQEDPNKPAPELLDDNKQGRLNGWGQVDYAGGDQYIGEFRDGKRSGHGKMIFN